MILFVLKGISSYCLRVPPQQKITKIQVWWVNISKTQFGDSNWKFQGSRLAELGQMNESACLAEMATNFETMKPYPNWNRLGAKPHSADSCGKQRKEPVGFSPKEDAAQVFRWNSSLPHLPVFFSVRVADSKTKTASKSSRTGAESVKRRTPRSLDFGQKVACENWHHLPVGSPKQSCNQRKSTVILQKNSRICWLLTGTQKFRGQVREALAAHMSKTQTAHVSLVASDEGKDVAAPARCYL